MLRLKKILPVVIFLTLILTSLYYYEIISNYLETFAEWAYPNEINRNGKIFQLILNILAGIAVLFGLYVSHRRARAMEIGVEKQSDQIELSRKAQTDERFKNAIEHLGSDKEPIIIGGIAELHQIAIDDSEKYAEVVFNILTSYIRTSSNREIAASDINRTVIQTIINYIFKTSDSSNYPYNGLCADLSFTNLNSNNFDSVSLFNSKLSFCLLPSMENANFDFCDFSASNFTMEVLNSVTFNNCDMFNTFFLGAELSNVEINSSPNSSLGVHFLNTKFSDVTFSEIKFYHSNFIGCELKDCLFDRSELFHCCLNTSSFNSVSFNRTKVSKCSFKAAGFKDVTFGGEIYFNEYQGANQETEYYTYFVDKKSNERINQKTNINGTNLTILNLIESNTDKLTASDVQEINDHYSKILVEYRFKRKLDKSVND